MQNGRLAVHTQRSDYGRYQGLVIGIEHPDGFNYIKGPLKFEPLNPTMMLIDPTFEGALCNELLQAMLDEAWRQGMRPTNYREERPAEIAAMNHHLQDMRALVFSSQITPVPSFLKQGVAVDEPRHDHHHQR